MKNIYHFNFLLIFFLCIILSSCGTIKNDGFNTYTEDFKFGDIRAKLFGEQRGNIFIKRSAPYELLLSFSLKDKNIEKLLIKDLQLTDIKNNKVLFTKNLIYLDSKPRPNESRIYYSEKDILKDYTEVELKFKVEPIQQEKKDINEIKIYFKKLPTSRWWTFFELV